MLKVKLLNFINKNNLLTSEQFEFTTNSSAKHAITTIYDKFLDNLGNKQYTCAIFFKVKKAFGIRDHQISSKSYNLWLSRYFGTS